MSSFTWDDMKNQLKAIYDNLRTNEIKGNTTEIKVEPTYEVKTYEKSDRLDGYFSRGQSNAYRGSRGRGYNRFKENNQTSDTSRQPNDSRRVNPPNQYGRVSRCAICQSIYHWFKDCPHNVQGSNSKVTLFTHEVQKCYVQNFLGETLNLAVLDSGCTKTVCGQEWLKCYIESLCDDDRKKIQEFTSETEFKFGDGKVVASERSVVIPCSIAGKNMSLKTNVVKGEIPLLLSKEGMKVAESRIDWQRYSLTLYN